MTSATRLLEIDLPIVLAPMGGGPSTVELAAVVSNAGGLGSLAGGYLAPDQLRRQIRDLRSATARPFAVNLFVPTPADPADAEVERALRLLEPYRAELGLPAHPDLTAWAQDFDAQLEVVIAERVPVFSFTFGTLAEDPMQRLREAAALTIGTATNVAEAVALVESGVELVCAQGAEAGGHHGSWLAAAESSLIGTVALVPLVCDAIGVPVIAAGGIMDSRGVAAVLRLGAGAAQMGTAFMLCPEAGTSPAHREAIGRATETDVALTSKVTGRLARGVRNRLMTELEGAEVPPYPVMNALTSEVRRTASARGDSELMSLWCGEGAPLARRPPLRAADLIRVLVGSVPDAAVPASDPEASAAYTHGHHDSVLRSHRWRTAENSASYLLPHLAPGMDLLDVGCGPGTITVDLAARVAPGQTVGTDNAFAAITAAREAVADVPVHFQVSDVMRLDFPDTSFDVVHAHQVLQHLADPIGALVEMARVCRPGGIVAARDSDYAAMTWFPADPGLDAWLALYRQVARANGAEPDAGRRLLDWAVRAGLGDVRASASVWCFASPEDRAWWSGLWAERVTQSSLADRAIELGLATTMDLEHIAAAWRRWAEAATGWFTVLHGEVLATTPA